MNTDNKTKRIKFLTFGLSMNLFGLEKIISIGLVLIMIRSLAALILPYATKSLIDDIIPNKIIHL